MFRLYCYLKVVKWRKFINLSLFSLFMYELNGKQVNIQLAKAESKMDLETFTSRLGDWADLATRMYGRYHRASVVTDLAVAQEMLASSSVEVVHDSCIDNSTTTIYYTTPKTGDRAYIVGLYGYKLINAQFY